MSLINWWVFIVWAGIKVLRQFPKDWQKCLSVPAAPWACCSVSPHTCHGHRASLCCVVMLLTGKIMKVIKMSASVFQLCKLHMHSAFLASRTTSKGCLWLSAWITTGTSPTILIRLCGSAISPALLPSHSSGCNWAQGGFGAWGHGQMHHCHQFKIGCDGKC